MFAIDIKCFLCGESMSLNLVHLDMHRWMSFPRTMTYQDRYGSTDPASIPTSQDCRETKPLSCYGSELHRPTWWQVQVRPILLLLRVLRCLGPLLLQPLDQVRRFIQTDIQEHFLKTSLYISMEELNARKNIRGKTLSKNLFTQVSLSVAI